SVSASATPDASLTDVERSSTPPPRPQRVPGVIEPEASANAETESAPIEPEQAKPPAPEAVKPRARSGAERSEPSQQTRRQPRAPAKRPPSKQTGAQQGRLHSADDRKAPFGVGPGPPGTPNGEPPAPPAWPQAKRAGLQCYCV